VTKSRNQKLIRVTSSNECQKHKCVDLSDCDIYLNQIWYRAQIPHYQHTGITRIPSFQSAGMWPVLQTRVNRKCRAFATGVMAYFSSSATIPSEPGARPFRSLVMALVTSDSEGSSVEAEASAVAEDDSVSKLAPKSHTQVT